MRRSLCQPAPRCRRSFSGKMGVITTTTQPERAPFIVRMGLPWRSGWSGVGMVTITGVKRGSPSWPTKYPSVSAGTSSMRSVGRRTQAPWSTGCTPAMMTSATTSSPAPRPPSSPAPSAPSSSPTKSRTSQSGLVVRPSTTGKRGCPRMWGTECGWGWENFTTTTKLSLSCST